MHKHNGKVFAIVTSAGTTLVPFEKLTTTDVNELIIKPLLESCRSSYCEYLEDNAGQASEVGLADVFISHAWRYLFVDLCNSLLFHFRDEPGIIIWLDLFSNNQIQAPNLDFDWWATTFRSAIQDFGRVVVVISPWFDPIVFTRAWCLYELLCAIIANCVVEVAMSVEVKQQFLEQIMKDPTSYLQMLGNINVAKSECFKQEDLDQIFLVVNQLPNKENTVNATICDHMRQWVVGELSRERDGASPRDKANAKRALAMILIDQGKYPEALELLEELLPTYQMLGNGDDENEDVAGTYNNMGRVYDKQGQYENALEQYSKSLQIELAKLGPNHPDVATTYNDMAVVYESQGQYEKALELYSKDLEIRLAKLGPEHPSVATTYNNMAGVYKKQGQYEKALELYSKDLEISLAKLGPDHPSVATTYNNMALVYKSQGQYEKALELYSKSLEIKLAKLGPDHPSTKSTKNSLQDCERKLNAS